MQYFFQEKANLCFSSIFPDVEKVYNRQKHQLSSYYHYLQLSTHYLKTQFSTYGYCIILYTYICSTFTLVGILSFFFLLSSLLIRYASEICFISRFIYMVPLVSTRHSYLTSDNYTSVDHRKKTLCPI